MRRVRGTGSIEKYRDALGEWRHRARVVLASGRRVPVGVFKTEREGQIALDDALAKYRAGAAVDISVGITVRQWGASFLDQRDEQGIRGIKTERNRWKNLVDASPLADVILAAVVRRDAKQWLAWLQARRIKYKHAHSRNGKKLSRVTLQNALNLVRKAFDVALDDELVAVNPFAGVRLPRNPGRTDDPWTFLTPAEQSALVAATPEGERDLVKFAIGSGLRQAEQWSLKWEDVFSRQVTVRFGDEAKPTKGGRVRHIPLFGVALEAAASAWLKWNRKATKLAFPAPSGARRQKGEPDGFKDWVRAAGIERNVRWHDLRHTCGTSLVRGWWGRAWSLQEVKEFLGHRSITTTERYAHGAELERAGADTPGVSPQHATEEATQEATAGAQTHSDSACNATGATFGIWTQDLRFTKACDTAATAPSSQSKSPLPGVQTFAVPIDGGCPASDAAPAADREVPALTTDPPYATFSTGYMGDPLAWCYWDSEYTEEGSCGPFATRAEAVEHARENGGYGEEPGQEPPITAEVASHAGLSPMLLAEAMRDVMQRRAGR